MSSRKDGIVIILSSPSGAGKTTLVKKIAKENNLSETAFFINKKNKFDIRWFTPVSELDLAGHPTLATAHVIIKELNFKLDKIIFNAKIKDTLTVTKEKNLFMTEMTDSMI